MGKKEPSLRIIEDQVKIEEKSIIQTTRALNVEVEKIGDIGRTADPLELLYDPADIFLLFSCTRRLSNMHSSRL
jgi:hypothetical protein